MSVSSPFILFSAPRNFEGKTQAILNKELLESTGTPDAFDSGGPVNIVRSNRRMIVDRMTLSSYEDVSKQKLENDRPLTSSTLFKPVFLQKNPYFTCSIFASRANFHDRNSQLEVDSGVSLSSDLPTDSSLSENPPSSRIESKKILRVKPSTLREMNFWSPTSM